MAQYNTGTVTTQAGSATITGTNTAWLANVAQGDLIKIGDDSVFYTVGSVASDTSLYLTVTYPSTVTGEDYVVVKDFTGNFDIPLMNHGDLDSPEIFTRAMEVIDTAMQPYQVGLTFKGNIQDSVTNTPPGSPYPGWKYVIGSNPTGAWLGRAGQIATSQGGTNWDYETPADGYYVFNLATGLFMVYRVNAQASLSAWQTLVMQVSNNAISSLWNSAKDLTPRDITMGSDGGGARTLKLWSGSAGKSSTIATDSAGSLNLTSGVHFVLQTAANCILSLISGTGADMRIKAGGLFRWQDVDASNTDRMMLDSATGLLTVLGDMTMGSDGGGNRTITVYGSSAGKYGKLSTNSAGATLEAVGGYVNLISAGAQSQYFDCGGYFTFRDKDASNATRMMLDSASGELTISGALGLRAAAGTLADGDWQFVRSGADLLIQKRVGGAWVTKSTILGA